MAVVISITAYSRTLTGYAVAITFGVASINFIDGWLEKKQQLSTMQALGEISSLLFQVFSGKHQVTVMQLEPFFLDRFNTIQIEALRCVRHISGGARSGFVLMLLLFSIRLRRRISHLRAFTFGLSQTAVFWGHTLFLYLAAHEIVHNDITFETAIAYEQKIH